MIDRKPPRKYRLRANSRDRVLGSRVKIRRRALELTQAELGERIGVSAQMIRKYERGISRLSALALFDIARALNVRMDSFFPSSDERFHMREASQDAPVQV